MVTQVIDDAGQLVHDCTADGCLLSWDGFVLAAGAYSVEAGELGGSIPQGGFHNGDAGDGRADPDGTVWSINAGTATQVPSGG
jgi:hypothetical protein